MLEQMRSFCEPVVVLIWKQADLIEELQASGIEAHVMPKYNISNEYKMIRLKINFWYQYFKLKSPSTDIQKKYHATFRPSASVLKQKIREKILWLRLKVNTGYIKKLIALEENQLSQEPTFAEYRSWLTTLNAEGIFTVTPFLVEVELVARILKGSSFKLIASIHSFDNVTKRGWAAIFFDDYFVWNKYNKAELERINPLFKNTGRINITGAPQFDFHYNKQYCWSKDEWLQRLGLPHGKKVILYAGGSANQLPNEPQYIKHIATAFEDKLISDDAIILFRCHPLDTIDRWKAYIGYSPFVYYDYKPPAEGRLDHNNFTKEDEQRLISTLYHTDVHINLSSTMAVDGSIFNKPQIAPYYDDIRKDAEPYLRGVYYQEHYQPIVNSGVLNFAGSRGQLISLVKETLQNPTGYNAKCQDCVREIATYTDGRSTERVIAKMKTFFA